ncbi:hypothetical protein ScPMuIL_003208 [Solemya velum]
MGFGTDLQGKKSHEALLRLQDAEIKLLENIKRCITIKAECDKKYAASLATMVQQAQKLEQTEFHSCCGVFQAWECIVQQTDNFAQLLKNNVEELSNKTLEKLNLLISEKKTSKKTYIDERNRLEYEFNKIQDELQRNKQEYIRLVDRAKVDKARFEDIQAKGRVGSKLDDAKTKYQKTTMKLHKCHNEYVLSLHEVGSHQKSYLTWILPKFLDCHQVTQELLVQQSKKILEDYSSLTNFSRPECRDIFSAMEVAVEDITPDSEYTSTFLAENRSNPLQKVQFDFDSKILLDYQGSITANKLLVNDLTYEALLHRKSTVGEELSQLKQMLEDKERSHKDLKEELCKLTEQLFQTKDEPVTTSYGEVKKNTELSEKEMGEIRATIDKKQVVYDTVQRELDAVDSNPPAALPDFPDPPDNMSGDILFAAGTRSTLGNIRNKLKGLKIPGRERSEKPAFYEESVIEENGLNGCVSLSPSKLEDEEWFHGVLPREEVQRLLKEDGDYLVRESRNKRTNEVQYVLSVYWQGHRHFIIQYGEGGWRFEGNSYKTIPELIQHQHECGTQVTSKSQAILHKPICREDWELRNDDICLEMKIGNGNFGEVYKGMYSPENLTVAVKTCRDTLSEDQRKKFLQEGRILKQYDHPNIVKFIGIAAQRQPVMIVMEYVAGGALLTFLRKLGKTQTPKQLVKMCEDASNGMAYLESKNCIHRDLAARNCLVGEENVVKISDFGMSREEEEYTVSDGMKQIPIKWTAPEALNYGKYTVMCDVWSFGILMWEIFSLGIIPYQGMSSAQAREKIESGYRMPAPSGTPAKLYDLMLDTWKYDPTNRPRFAEVHTRLKDLCDSL